MEIKEKCEQEVSYGLQGKEGIIEKIEVNEKQKYLTANDRKSTNTKNKQKIKTWSDEKYLKGKQERNKLTLKYLQTETEEDKRVQRE